MKTAITRWLGSAGITAVACCQGFTAERHQSFDTDPKWHGHNNRSARPETIRQDFGWSAETTNAGSGLGEIGGTIMPAAEPAWYAKFLQETQTFGDRFSASGTFMVEKGGGHTFIGLFNSGTLNEWRTPNTIGFRINSRGDVFHCHLEYCTSRWRAGAGIVGQYDRERDRMNPIELVCGKVYRWTLQYDPAASNGLGLVTATVDNRVAACELSDGHKADGAKFDRFGILNIMKQYDGAGRLWIDDVVINGEKEDFSRNPKWSAFRNRQTYASYNVRPRFDFGFTVSQHAGGKHAGELGGLFFRGDCRYPERLAAYGDRLAPLSLEKPLRASGKLAMKRGVSDSTTLIGFYHSMHSLEVNPSQDIVTPRDFVGAAIEGPSREGFYFYPVYRNHERDVSRGMGSNPPRIFPNGASHDWTLAYDPAAANGQGRLTVTLDGQSTSVDLAPGDKSRGAQFDRFGLVTPWIDGNGQHVYFDDLTYTVSQE